MDAQAALDELTILSAQVVEAVVAMTGGSALAATVADQDRANALARVAHDVLATAAGVRRAGPGVERVEVVLPQGGLFVVTDGDRLVAATTGPEPVAGLVLYDLRTVLRRLHQQEPAPRRRARGRRTKEAGDA